jgi:hypothetical protein
MLSSVDDGNNIVWPHDELIGSSLRDWCLPGLDMDKGSLCPSLDRPRTVPLQKASGTQGPLAAAHRDGTLSGKDSRAPVARFVRSQAFGSLHRASQFPGWYSRCVCPLSCSR